MLSTCLNDDDWHGGYDRLVKQLLHHCFRICPLRAPLRDGADDARCVVEASRHLLRQPTGVCLPCCQTVRMWGCHDMLPDCLLLAMSPQRPLR
jgi:hypothetical protein